MYGRNNIFSNNNTSGYNNTSSYGSSNNYRPNNQRGLGSYRLDYKYEQPPSYLTSVVFQWKENPPASIIARDETMHLTTTELRIEDYFLIRKKELKSAHQARLRQAIRNDCFNEDIAKVQFDRLPPVSEERPLDIDAIRNARSHTQNNSNNSSYSRDNDNRGNIFSGGSNNVSTNIFSQNSSNSRIGNNNSSGSIFSGNRDSNSGNLFSGNPSRNNLFSNTSNNNNSSYGNNGGNIFNTRSNNSSGNIFTNNNTNNNNTNNNNNNSGNLFGTRNSNSSNIFNNSSSSNNNIFGNRSGGNNLFGNNNNNNNSNVSIPPQLLLNFQYVLEEANKIMKSAQQKNTLYNREDQQSTRNNLTPFEELAKRNDPVDINHFLQDSKKRPPTQSQSIKLVKPEWFQEYQQLKKSQMYNQSKVINGNQSKVVDNSRIASKNKSELISNQGSRIFNNGNKNHQLMKTESKLISNTVRCEQSSVRKSTTTMMQNVMQEWPGPCMCNFDLEIEWQDDDRNEMKSERIRAKLQMQQMKLHDNQWQKQSVLKLKQFNKIVRSDALIVVSSCSQKEKIANAEFVIKGKLKQKIINLPTSYKVCYSQIRQGLLYNLVISNQYGSIAWEEPISAIDLDFADYTEMEPLNISQNQVICELDALNSKCRVSFVGLPRHLEACCGNEPEFQKQVTDFKQFVKKKTNGAFEVMDVWKKQKGSAYISGWTLFASHFPRLEQQVQEQ